MASIDHQVDLNANPTERFSALEFYKNKTILIVGGTGFVGKVLIAKLLKEFHSNLTKIYVLIREKRSQTPQQRLDDLFSDKCPIFKNLNDHKHLVQAISADIALKDLGLSLEDQQSLVNEVQVVFHLAATVSFSRPLRTYFEQNIDATDSLMKLCLKMNNLQSVVYVSTAYANCQLSRIEERVYPVLDEKDQKDFQDLESYLEHLRANFSDLNPPEYHPVLKGRPNPYTLSKSITELMIQERYSGLLPVIICRPSIVISSWTDPEPGWCDSITGPTSFMISGYTGSFRTWIVNKDVRQDMIPVDLVSNSLIIAAAFRGSPGSYSPDRMVVNLTANQYTFDWDELEPVCRQNPTMKMVRRIKLEQNKYETIPEKIRLHSKIWLLHYPLALVLSLISWFQGRKSVWNQFKRGHEAMFVLKAFTIKEWDLPNPNLKYMTGLLADKERPIFPTSVDTVDWNQYLKNYVLGVRRYMLNDPDYTLDRARNRQRWLEVLSWIFKFLMLLLLNVLLWFGLKMLGAPFFDDDYIILVLSAINFQYFIPKLLRNMSQANHV